MADGDHADRRVLLGDVQQGRQPGHGMATEEAGRQALVHGRQEYVLEGGSGVYPPVGDRPFDLFPVG